MLMAPPITIPVILARAHHSALFFASASFSSPCLIRYVRAAAVPSVSDWGPTGSPPASSASCFYLQENTKLKASSGHQKSYTLSLITIGSVFFIKVHEVKKPLIKDIGPANRVRLTVLDCYLFKGVMTLVKVTSLLFVNSEAYHEHMGLKPSSNGSLVIGLSNA